MANERQLLVVPGLSNILATINSQKGIPDGITPLGSDLKIPAIYLPSIAITNTYVVSSEAEMLNLSANTGSVAIRSDINTSFILREGSPTLLSNWNEILTPAQVSSVNGQIGSVTLTTDNIAQGVNNIYFPGFGLTNEKVSRGNHLHTGVYEAALGNPLVDGYVLSKTTTGIVSWVRKSENTFPILSANSSGGEIQISTSASQITSGMINLKVDGSYGNYGVNIQSVTTSGGGFTGIYLNIGTRDYGEVIENYGTEAFKIINYGSTGYGMKIENRSTAKGIYVDNYSTGIPFEILCQENTGTHKKVTIDAYGNLNLPSGSKYYIDEVDITYSLPTASDTVLGGIKIGSGLSINGSGVVTASISLPLTINNASTSQIQVSTSSTHANSGLIGLYLATTGTPGLYITNLGASIGINILNSSSGTGHYINNSSSGKAIDILNSGTGYALNITTSSTYSGIQVTNTSTGSGLYILSSGSSSGNAILIDNSKTNSSGIGVLISNNNIGKGLDIRNLSTGYGEIITNSNDGTGLYIINSTTANGSGVFVDNSKASGSGIYVYNSSTGIGTTIANTSTGTGLKIASSSTGMDFAIYDSTPTLRTLLHPSIGTTATNGAYIFGTTSTVTSGKLVSVKNNTVETFSIDKDGNVDIPSGAVYKINGVEIGNSYSLPTASGSVLGGVKIGTGLGIDGYGVVSVTAIPSTFPIIGSSTSDIIKLKTLVADNYVEDALINITNNSDIYIPAHGIHIINSSANRYGIYSENTSTNTGIRASNTNSSGSAIEIIASSGKGLNVISGGITVNLGAITLPTGASGISIADGAGGITIINSGSNTGLQITNSTTGIDYCGQTITNNSSGIGSRVANMSTGVGLSINNFSTGLPFGIYGGYTLLSSFNPTIADGATAKAYTLNTLYNLSTTGAKLFILQNYGSEKFSVDKDGNVNIPAGKEFRINGVAIPSTGGAVSFPISTTTATPSAGINLQEASSSLVAEGLLNISLAPGGYYKGIRMNNEGIAEALHISLGTGSSNSKGIRISCINNQSTPFTIEKGTSTTVTSFTPNVIDGGSAIAYTFSTGNALSTTGAKLFSLKNNNVEKLYVSKDGDIYVRGVLLQGGQDISGKEDITNKVTNFTTLNDTLYPSVQAVETEILAQIAKIKPLGYAGLIM